MKIFATLVAMVLLPLGIAQAAPEGKPVVVSRALQYDISSQITGRTYRVWVSVPAKADPTVALPVLYVLDGNQYFMAAVETMATQGLNPPVSPAIVVGIGYPVDDLIEALKLRFFDLTPSVSNDPTQIPPVDRYKNVRTGGGDAFLQAIEKEIKPFVEAHYKIDKTKQIFYGHSLGGLMVLQQLFRSPEAFSTYIISSPSIWWNNREVLANEEAFSKHVRAGKVHARILVTSAGDEQPQDNPRSARSRMVDNASELAERLSKLDPETTRVVRTTFAGENHNSVPPASLSRAVQFALTRE